MEMSEELKELLELARKVEMTAEEREAQRLSFAYGNTSIDNPRITKEMIIAAANALKGK